MKIHLALAAAFFCFPHASAANLGSVLDANGGGAIRFGVESANYSRNADVAFAPASNSKMFTALALLEAMGGDTSIPTVLQWTSSADGAAANLRVLGYGDPSYGLTELGENNGTRVALFAKALWDSGVRDLYGDITLSAADARFANLRYPEGWTADDPMTCDGALGQAFNMNLNCGSYRVNSATSGQWLQAGVTGNVKLQITDGARTSLLLGLADVAHPGLGFILKGTLAKGSRPVYAIPVLNADAWVKNLFITALQKQGITLHPGTAPVAGAPQARTFHSPKLSVIVKAMMKNSINMIGDSLLRILASNYGTPATRDLLTDGQTYLRQYMLNIGVPDAFKLYDGAGLSRQSRITPRALYAFLNYARASREFKNFYAALPIAGIDGTLRNRMKGTAAYNRLRAKTGTLDGVYNLSGFVPSAGGYEPFVLLTSTTVARAATARGAENRFGAALASSLHRMLEPQVGEVPFPYVPEHAGQDDQ